MQKVHSQDSIIWQVAIVILLLIVTAITLPRLDADPYWVDEVISAQRSGQTDYDPDSSVRAIWQRTAQISDQVPGYYIILGLWSNIAGKSPFAGRILSLFFGLITIATVYQLGRCFTNRLTGFAASLALVSSAFYMLFLHEMRTYSLLLCLIILLLWFYWLITQGYIRWWVQVGLILSVALMLYSYYLSIVVIASVCLYHLLFVKKDREWWRIVILMGTAGALFIPWMLTAFSVFDDEGRNFLRQAFASDNSEMLVAIGAAFSNKNTALLGLIFLFALRLRQDFARYTWFVFLTSLTLMIILNTQFGVFVNLRYSLLLWIPMALLVGIGVQHIAQRGVPAPIILTVIFGVGIISIFDSDLTDEYDLPIRYLPWDTLTEVVNEYQQAGDKLAFLVTIEGNDWAGVHEERVMPHYFHGSLVEPIFLEDVRNLPDADFLIEGQTFVQGADRVWLSYPPRLRSWRTGLFADMLREENYQLCGNFVDTDELYLDLYAHPNAVNTGETYHFGDNNAQGHLTPLQVIPDTVNNGSLQLIHAWTLDDDFARDTYSLAVHIVNSAGDLVVQADYGLPTESFDCVATMINLSQIGQGEYEVRSFVYAWQDGTPLAIVGDTLSSDYISLGHFIIDGG